MGETSVAAATTFLRVADLYKSYGKQVAVDGLSFEINRGETFGLLGPNGAGKTTTISILVGLLSPDSGSAEIISEGVNSNDPTFPALRRLVGLAPQSLSLYEELTAKENLNFFGGLYGLSGRALAERTEWCLDFAGLQDRKNDRAATFSGGMQRRLNIAAALVHEPEILLLDEPTVGVDPQSRNHIFESIQTLAKQGMTIIYTTHYMEEAQRLCDRVAIIDHGKMMACDSVPGLLHAYGGDSVVVAQLRRETELPSHASTLKAFSHEGDQLRFESTTPVEDIARLSNGGLHFTNLQIQQPDLESVFLSLTGRSLRD